MKRPSKIVIIGGSAGSLEVLLAAVPDIVIPEGLAIVVVIHRKFTSDDSLAKLLRFKTSLHVSEVEDKQPLKAGNIYIAPVDYHVLFEKDGTFALDVSEKVQFSRPSIDVSFESAADVYRDGLTCILLSGSNADGVQGMKEAQEYGASIAVQLPETAAFPFMPQSAVSTMKVNAILRPENIAAFINAL